MMFLTIASSISFAIASRNSGLTEYDFQSSRSAPDESLRSFPALSLPNITTSTARSITSSQYARFFLVWTSDVMPSPKATSVSLNTFSACE